MEKNKELNEIIYLKIIVGINKKDWWRTTLPNKEEIKKRGLFLASTYEEAEFYGRPLDEPFKVNIKKPYISSPSKLDKDILGEAMDADLGVEARFKADEMIKKKLEQKGFDAVIIVPDKYLSTVLTTGRLPKQIELNLFNEIFKNKK